MQYTYGRRSNVYIGINNKDVSGDIRRFITSFTFEENADGASDELIIELMDNEHRWLTDWHTALCTKFDAKIEVRDWNYTGDNRYIDCGEFYQDSFSVTGFPVFCTVKALSLPNISNKNSKSWENVKIKELSEEIAQKVNCNLEFLCDDFGIDEISQDNEKDISFLYKVCKEYGLGMKAYTNKIIIFEREQLEKSDAVFDIDMRQMEDFLIEESITGTYTGAKLTYTNAKTDKTYTYQTGSNERLLIVDESVSSQAEAERKTKARLYEENSKAIKISFRIEGGKDIYAGMCYNLTGFGRYSGKYFFDTVRHSISKGYFISVSAHKTQ